MLEKILDVERETFLWLNGCHTAFGDSFFWMYSGAVAWIPVAVAFVGVYMYSNRARWREALLVMAAIVVVIALCDQFSSGFCKPFFARFRPTHHPDFKDVVQIVNDYRGGRYGFISSHAANSFGFATLTALIFRYRPYTIALFAWAAVFAYSRIYLGVHFISDIVAGAISGAILGWVVYRLYTVVGRRVFAHSGNPYSPPSKGLQLILCLLAATVVVMFLL